MVAAPAPRNEPVGPPQKPQPEPWSDSDRVALEALLEERAHVEWLQKRRERLFSSAKAVAQWVTALALGFGVLKDLLSSIWNAFIQWLQGASP